MPVENGYINVRVKVPEDWFYDIEAGLGIEMSDLDEGILSEFLSYLVGYGSQKTEDLLEILENKVEDDSVYIDKCKIDYDKFDKANKYVVNRLTEDNVYELVGNYSSMNDAVRAVGEAK